MPAPNRSPRNVPRQTPTPAPAFTLVELLVVMSLIALLIALLLPALSGAHRSAQTTRCLSGQRQLGVGIHNYASDHRGHIPLSPSLPDHVGPLPVSPDLPSNQLFVARPTADDARYAAHGLLLDGYLSASEAANCPATSRADLLAGSLDSLALLNQDAWSNYLYRNRFAATGDRVDALGHNPAGKPAAALLYDFNQVRLDAVGQGADALNHRGRTVNALYLDGHAASHDNETGRFNLSATDPNPFATVAQAFTTLDEE